MAAISLRKVVKRYGDGARSHTVIHGLDADIGDGEFVVIVGPSGCGKSTLLRMVAGLEEVSDGEIHIGERLVNDVEPADRDIAMVFQNYALYPHMSVFDNMAYGLKIRRLAHDEIRRRVERAAGILELGALLQRKPRQLSGGQRQRVAMGRAIVRDPQVFLFDEPLSNLDAKLRAQTRLEIRKLHAELGVTSLFVTHDQVEAMTLAQRMIVMNGGRMEQFGTPAEVYARPASTFVASFIGSPPMNLLRGRVEGSNVGPGVGSGVGSHFVCGEAHLALPGAAPRTGELILGVRPEHLRTDAAGGWPFRAGMSEMLGAERLVYGQLGDAALILRVDATQPELQPGTTLGLCAQPEHLHWFDAHSLARVE